MPHTELEETDELLYLAKRYVRDVGLTHMDAFHIATAVVYNMDVFLSFNRRTIVNKKIVTKLNKLNDTMGYRTPLLLTPDELCERINKDVVHR